MTIDTQAISTMLTWLGISVGAAVVLAVSCLGAIAAWQRYDRKQHVSALERYLATVAGHRDATRGETRA
jgi:hypothetical protein